MSQSILGRPSLPLTPLGYEAYRPCRSRTDNKQDDLLNRGRASTGFRKRGTFPVKRINDAKKKKGQSRMFFPDLGFWGYEPGVWGNQRVITDVRQEGDSRSAMKTWQAGAVLTGPTTGTNPGGGVCAHIRVHTKKPGTNVGTKAHVKSVAHGCPAHKGVGVSRKQNRGGRCKLDETTEHGRARRGRESRGSNAGGPDTKNAQVPWGGGTD